MEAARVSDDQFAVQTPFDFVEFVFFHCFIDTKYHTIPEYIILVCKDQLKVLRSGRLFQINSQKLE